MFLRLFSMFMFISIIVLYSTLRVNFITLLFFRSNDTQMFVHVHIYSSPQSCSLRVKIFLYGIENKMTSALFENIEQHIPVHSIK